MNFFGFRFAKTKARHADGADLNRTRKNRWDDFFKSGPHVSDDFMQEREQPAAEKREPF